VPHWSQLPREHVNQLLACNFGVMAVLGQRVLKPFLQDTIQLLPLAATMGGMMLANPPVICRVLPQVSIGNGSICGGLCLLHCTVFALIMHMWSQHVPEVDG
jgi:hypothetical protein